MELVHAVLPAFLLAIGILALIRLLRTPIRLALKLLSHTILGFLALGLIHLTTGVTGITLGLNLWNALVAGILGIPGLLLLLLMRWIL